MYDNALHADPDSNEWLANKVRRMAFEGIRNQI